MLVNKQKDKKGQKQLLIKGGAGVLNLLTDKKTEVEFYVSTSVFLH